jgi:hypothetical protein
MNQNLHSMKEDCEQVKYTLWRIQFFTLTFSALPVMICITATSEANQSSKTRDLTSHSTFSIFFFNGSTAPLGPRLPQFLRLHDHTFRHTTLGRTPLDEGPARRRDLYLTTHNTHKRQTSMPPAGFKPTIPVSKRPQTHAFDRATTGISSSQLQQ